MFAYLADGLFNNWTSSLIQGYGRMFQPSKLLVLPLFIRRQKWGPICSVRTVNRAANIAMQPRAVTPKRDEVRQRLMFFIELLIRPHILHSDAQSRQPAGTVLRVSKVRLDRQINDPFAEPNARLRARYRTGRTHPLAYARGTVPAGRIRLLTSAAPHPSCYANTFRIGSPPKFVSR